MKTQKIWNLDLGEFVYRLSSLKVAGDFTTDGLVWPAVKDFEASIPFPQSCLILFQTGAVRPAPGR